MFRISGRTKLLLFWLLEAVLYTAIAYGVLPTGLRGLFLVFGLLLLCAARLPLRPFIRIPVLLFCALLIAGLRWLHLYEARFGLPGIEAYNALFQSDAGEGFSYFLFLADITVFIAPLLFLYLAIRGQKLLRIPKPLAVKFLAANLGLCVVALFLAHQSVRTYVDAFLRSTQELQQEMAQQQVLVDRYKEDSDISKLPPLPLANFKGNIIFVIGESTTRRHMSLYGYYRPTTPKLDAWSPSLFVQQDTLSPHSHTVQSLTETLTQRNADNPALNHALSHSLIVQLRRSGFKTWWFSNQNEYGVWENPISVIGKQADTSFFLRKTYGAKVMDGFYSDHMFPLVKKALAAPDPRKFVVMRLYATHHPYCGVVPPAYRDVLKASDLGQAYFGKAEDQSEQVNCYDNAVRYVDSLLGSVLDMAKAQTMPTAVVYISDHGENPADGSGHNAGWHSAYHVEVPHIWYFNAAAERDEAAKIATLKTHLNVPYRLSRHYDTLLDLAGVDPSLFKYDRSLFSAAFAPSKQRKTISSADGKTFVDYDLLTPDKKDHLEVTRINMKLLRETAPQAYEKLWAHRVNSLGMLGEAAPYFSGVELDLVYDDKTQRFDVRHPPSPSIGLSLETYLKAASHYPRLQFWLDWKNASPQNIGPALQELQRLDALFHFRERALVETASDAVFAGLKTLAGAGFRHSYYLPTEDVVRCSAAAQTAPCLTLKDSIVKNTDLVGASYLSFDARGLPFMRAHAQAFQAFRLASWDTDKSTGALDFKDKLPPLEGISIMLVGFPSIFAY